MLLFDRVLMFLGSPSANCQIAQVHLLVWQHPRRLLLANWSALLSPPSPCSLRSQDTSWLLPKLFPLPRGLLYISKALLKYHLLQAVLLLHLLHVLPSFCPSLIKPLSCPSTTPEPPNFPPSQYLPHCRPSQPHLLWCFPSLLWSVHAGFLCSLPLSAGPLHRLCQSSAWNAPLPSHSCCPPPKLFLPGTLQLSYSALLHIWDITFLLWFLGYPLSPWPQESKHCNLNA